MQIYIHVYIYGRLIQTSKIIISQPTYSRSGSQVAIWQSKAVPNPGQDAIALQGALTPILAQTETMQKSQFTWHERLWNVGGNHSIQRKPMQIWGECANSTQTVVPAQNQLFFHQWCNEMTLNETTLFEDMLYIGIRAVTTALYESL